MRRKRPSRGEGGRPRPFTADDGALIADYFRRHASELQHTDGPEANEGPTVAGATPPNKRAT